MLARLSVFILTLLSFSLLAAENASVFAPLKSYLASLEGKNCSGHLAQTTRPVRIIIGLGGEDKTPASARQAIGLKMLDKLADDFCGLPEDADATIIVPRMFGPYGDMQAFVVPPEHNLDWWPRIVLVRLSQRSPEAIANVSQLVKELGVSNRSVLVLHDELDLTFESMEMRRSGGDGGHLGIRALRKSLGEDFYRLRLGIGRPTSRDQVQEYLASPPAPIRAPLGRVYNLVQHWLLLPEPFNVQKHPEVHSVALRKHLAIELSEKQLAAVDDFPISKLHFNSRPSSMVIALFAIRAPTQPRLGNLLDQSPDSLRTLGFTWGEIDTIHATLSLMFQRLHARSTSVNTLLNRSLPGIEPKYPDFRPN